MVNPDYRNLFSDHVRGYKPRGNGEAAGHCPFHDDRKKSFSCNIESGQWMCFAGCGSGNASQFAKKVGIDQSPNEGQKRVKRTLTPVDKENGETGQNTGLVGDSDGLELSSNHKKKANKCYKYLMENFDHLCGDLP